MQLISFAIDLVGRVATIFLRKMLNGIEGTKFKSWKQGFLEMNLTGYKYVKV